MLNQNNQPPQVATLPLPDLQTEVRKEVGLSDFWSPDRRQDPDGPTVIVDLVPGEKGWSVYLRTDSGSIHLETFPTEQQAMKMIRWWYYNGQLHRLANLPTPKRSANSHSRCKSCGCRITWLTTKKGKPMPVNGWIRVKDGQYQKGMDPHWALCPHAKGWKK